MPNDKLLENEEFLPAALEIIETPPSPIGRSVALVIAAMFVGLLAWSYFGQVDVVITGQGKVIPSGHVKTVQAFESGVVLEILVHDGQLVEVGQALIELDPTDTESSIDGLVAQKQVTMLDLAVSEALLSENPLTYEIRKFLFDPASLEIARLQIKDNFEQHNAALQELAAEEERLISQIASLVIQAQTIDETVPILEQRLTSAGTLLVRDAMRQDDRLSLQQTLVETRAQKANLLQSKLQAQASIDAIRAQTRQTKASFNATHRAAVREAHATLAGLETQILAESNRNQYRTLTAPVSGFVDQLKTHTRGGVLNAGEIVANIVPTNSVHEIEAYIMNKDIGFIRPDNLAEIKLDAFPFTRYGVLEGRVASVSNDAIEHEQLGLVYKVSATITTPAQTLSEGGISVGAGMNATLEIITEKRRIIEYFISPLLRYRDEAIRER